MAEHRATFPCFGSECTVIVSNDRDDPAAHVAVIEAQRRLLEWHGRFSRFQPEGELSRLNADPRHSVPVSPLMGRILAAALQAARTTDGLVDATLIEELEQAGYGSDLPAPPVPLEIALALAPKRSPAGRNPHWVWPDVEVDPPGGCGDPRARCAI